MCFFGWYDDDFDVEVDRDFDGNVFFFGGHAATFPAGGGYEGGFDAGVRQLHDFGREVHREIVRRLAADVEHGGHREGVGELLEDLREEGVGAVGVGGELPDAVLEEGLLFLRCDAEDFEDRFPLQRAGSACLPDDKQFAFPDGRFLIAALVGPGHP